MDVTNHKWSTASSTPTDRYDLEQMFVHEFGHAIGLKHSSARKARMYPFIKDSSAPQRQLTVDDKVAVSGIYDMWTNETSFPNARDVGTGADGSVWITASDQTILKRSGTSWVATECCGNSIAVTSDGRPWVVAGDGTIWHRLSSNPASTGWVPYPGCAADIAAGKPSDVYILGCDDADGLGNHSILKLNGTSFSLIDQGGAGTRLSVASNGDLWVANSLGDLWSLDHAALTWTQWDITNVLDVGAGPVADQDTGLPQINYPFITKTDGRIWTLNAQSGVTVEGDDPEKAPSVLRWWQMGDVLARGTSIAVTSSGVPWTIGPSGDGVHHPIR